MPSRAAEDAHKPLRYRIGPDDLEGAGETGRHVRTRAAGFGLSFDFVEGGEDVGERQGPAGEEAGELEGAVGGQHLGRALRAMHPDRARLGIDDRDSPRTGLQVLPDPWAGREDLGELERPSGGQSGKARD